MRFNLTDTIAAIATPAGTSALAIVRISGKDAIPIVSDIFSDKAKLLSASGYQGVYGYIVDKEEIIDEVICLVFINPHSYTGEDLVEISGHGNPDLTNRILQLLLRKCRLAEPGEFTFRAFMNHKLDLVQAEAVNDLIQAQTGKAETAALNQLKGNLSKEISTLITDLTDCRIRFELSIDFADQDLPAIDLNSVEEKIEVSLARLQKLFAGGRQGKILRDGFTVCLCGAPNVGKSSVFNKFLQENRAIVTPQPGTTRDYLEEWISLEGFPVKLIDTAGLRDTTEQVEKLGIDKTVEIIEKADLVVCLTDPDTLEAEYLTPENIDACKSFFVLNKIDLLGFDTMPGEQDWNDYLKGSRFGILSVSDITVYPCSTLIPDGIIAIKEKILAQISLPDWQPSSILVTNTRHLAAIEKAINSLTNSLKAISESAGYEFIAFDLIEAVSALSEITGAVTTDDMLNRIFSSFCVGK